MKCSKLFETKFDLIICFSEAILMKQFRFMIKHNSTMLKFLSNNIYFDATHFEVQLFAKYAYHLYLLHSHSDIYSGDYFVKCYC